MFHLWKSATLLKTTVSFWLILLRKHYEGKNLKAKELRRLDPIQIYEFGLSISFLCMHVCVCMYTRITIYKCKIAFLPRVKLNLVCQFVSVLSILLHNWFHLLENAAMILFSRGHNPLLSNVLLLLLLLSDIFKFCSVVLLFPPFNCSFKQFWNVEQLLKFRN